MSYNPSAATRAITVEKKPTSLLIKAIPAPIRAGVPFTVAGTLLTDGIGVPGKYIYILYDSTHGVSPTTDVNGDFSAEITIYDPGTYTLTLEFHEDAEYLGISVTSPPFDVLPLVVDTDLIIAAPETVFVGETFRISGKLTRVDTGIGIGGQTIHVSYDTTIIGSIVTDADGGYSITASIPTAGTYTLRAEFLGAVGYGASFAGAGINVGVVMPPIDLPLIGGIALVVTDVALLLYYGATHMPS